MSDFIKRLFGRDNFDYEANIDRLRAQGRPIFTLPPDMANPLVDYMLERSYLEDVSERTDFNIVRMRPADSVAWLRVDRLPVSPLRVDDYDLLSRWQGALASLHAWRQKLLFLLQRRNGTTHLYIGVQGADVTEALKKCRTALVSSMPGIDLTALDSPDTLGEVLAVTRQISDSQCGGAVTGIPSFRRDTQFGVLQTLDKLAFGFQNANGSDANFSLIVVADPLTDAQISDIIARFQRLGSEIHTEVSAHVTEGESRSYSEASITSVSGGVAFGLGQGNIGPLTSMVSNALITANPAALAARKTVSMFLHAMGLQGSVGFGRTLSTSRGVSTSQSVSREYLNKFAQYSEALTDRHCERLRSGRDIGFWNAGVYILADTQDNVDLVGGMLRSVYSGDYTRVEPIRTHIFRSQQALDTVKNFNLVPLINPEANEFVGPDGAWHMFGPAYQYVSTPVNTEELSLYTSLPRRDVPGLRFVKNAARFANNPGTCAPGADTVRIGNIVDTGIVQHNPYTVPVDALVRHSLIVGATGCGKTTTCKSLINAVLDRRRPVLVIEPAKDEWVRWAIAHNRTVDAMDIPDEEKKARRITIFEPGLTSFEGTVLPGLRLNPFQPAAVPGAPVDMQTRCEKFTALINATLPTGDILPVIMDEALYSYLRDRVEDFEEEDMEPLTQYPLLEGALPVARRLLQDRGYEQRVTDSFIAALETRFKYLTRGKRGKILNQHLSTPAEVLFNGNCVINLSKIPNARDKALVMSLILLSLQEYRESAYTYDAEYRRRAQSGRLMHLTVIEEAHNVLTKPPVAAEGSGNPQGAVATLFADMLAQIRSLGEGFMIIDQTPTKLIPDVIKNTNYKICHRMGAIDDCAVMAQALALRDDQRGIIPTLEQGYAIIAGDMDDAASWVKISKPSINL